MPLSRPRLPTISIEPCLPSLAKTPPTGPDWIHEIKHDGFRVMVRRDGKKVRLISRNGKDLTYRFPLVVQSSTAGAFVRHRRRGDRQRRQRFGRFQFDPQLS
jgi:ATP-dependent DNA ligase